MLKPMKKNINMSKLVRTYGTLAGYVILLIAFTVLASGKFLTANNIITILRQIAMLAVISIGQTFVMITGRTDLSVGYSASAMGILVASLMVKHGGINMWLAVLITVIVAGLAGLINGLLVAYVGVPDFIGTLGFGYVISGINQAFTKGHPVTNLPAEFELFGAKRLFGVIPNAVIIMLLVLVVAGIILNQTKLGRYIYGVGDNEEATMMSGINTKRTITWAFVLSGMTCGITAIMLTSRLGSAHPQAAEDYLLNSIAAVWLGSTAFHDGQPNLAGTVLGALIIGTMSNGLTILNVEYYFQDIATGLIILAAVILSSMQRNNRK